MITGYGWKIFVNGEEFKMEPTKKLALKDKVYFDNSKEIYEVIGFDGDIVWIKEIGIEYRTTAHINRLSLVPKPFAEVAFFDSRHYLHIVGKPIAGTNNTMPGTLRNYTKEELEQCARTINEVFKERGGS